VASRRARFAHFAKTNKSAINTLVDENALPFELWVNDAHLAGVSTGALSKEDAPITLTYLPGATPEELMAKCDADQAGRAFYGVLHGHDEIAGFFEDIGFYGNGTRTKGRQSDLNYLMDKGRPSKVYRDESKGYGKDLHALYARAQSGAEPPKVQLLQLSGINARDAEKILRDDDPSNHSLATRERYTFFTAPVVNPYSAPPPHMRLPDSMYSPEGSVLQDLAGFRRDLLPQGMQVLEGMKRCFWFVEGEPNKKLKLTELGLWRFRRFDAMNWRLAGLLQYVDDQLAAELRQVQRMHGIRLAGRLGLLVLANCAPQGVNSNNFPITETLTDQVALTLACVLGSISVGFKGVSESLMPVLRPSETGEVDPKIFCRVLAPAFVHLLDEDPRGGAALAGAHRILEAAILGLMKETLLWPSSSFVSKGMITRFLNACAQGTQSPSAAWQHVQGHSSTTRSQWWLQNVALELVRHGFGSTVQAQDGVRWLKPTQEEMSANNGSLTTKANAMFQVTFESYSQHLAVPLMRPGRRRREPEEADRDEVQQTEPYARLADSSGASVLRRAVGLESHGSQRISPRELLRQHVAAGAVVVSGAEVRSEEVLRERASVEAEEQRHSLRRSDSSPSLAATPADTAADAESLAGDIDMGGNAGAPPRASVVDLYADAAMRQTLSLEAGADALAANNLRNIFHLAAVKSATPRELAAYARLDARLAEEESDICRRLCALIQGGWEDENLVALIDGADAPVGYMDTWIQWIDLSYVRLGRVPPERPYVREQRSVAGLPDRRLEIPARPGRM
jgi:hypothetical protein